MNFSFLPVKKTSLPGLFQLTSFDEDKWNKIYGGYCTVSKESIIQTQCLVKKRQICQVLESPQRRNVTESAAQDGAPPAKINDRAFPP